MRPNFDHSYPRFSTLSPFEEIGARVDVFCHKFNVETGICVDLSIIWHAFSSAKWSKFMRTSRTCGFLKYPCCLFLKALLIMSDWLWSYDDKCNVVNRPEINFSWSPFRRAASKHISNRPTQIIPKVPETFQPFWRSLLSSVQVVRSSWSCLRSCLRSDTFRKARLEIWGRVLLKDMERTKMAVILVSPH